MITLITFAIVFWIAYSVLNKFKRRGGEGISGSKTIVMNITPPTFKSEAEREQFLTQYEKKRKKLQVRDERRKRQNRIWAVLYYLSSYEKIMQPGYHTKKQEQQYANAQETLKEYRPTAPDVETAIRFCKIENVRGKCNHTLTSGDIDSIRKTLITHN
ncbi:MAG: hypothetical protein IJ144_05830 [Prevotella sp.]|nr:hypothetical protein [Prevotella sp.]